MQEIKYQPTENLFIVVALPLEQERKILTDDNGNLPRMILVNGEVKTEVEIYNCISYPYWEIPDSYCLSWTGLGTKELFELHKKQYHRKIDDGIGGKKKVPLIEESLCGFLICKTLTN
jgi:hypothetical protein